MSVLIGAEQNCCSLCRSLYCLLEEFAQKNWILGVDTTILSFNTWSEISGNTFEKTRFSSDYGVQM